MAKKEGPGAVNAAFLSQLNSRETPSRRELMGLVIRLSIPAILAEISAIVMQYIDAAMVGSLGEYASAAIGLVSSSTWLLNGLCISLATGFSVQIAHLIGAERPGEARSVLRQGLLASLFFSLLLGALGAALSFPLPRWLGGAADVNPHASEYFFIYACALPFAQIRQTAGAALQCSGDMKTPSLLNILLCGLDVVYNALFIFPARTVTLLGVSLRLPGADMGVAGAALGTALAEVTVALLMVGAVFFRSPVLKLSLGGSWRFTGPCMQKAVRIAVPAAVEHSVMNLAYIVSTAIVAPLGTTAVAAHTLATTAESFCYMPGYGIGAAATTLVGQSLGAGRKDLARRLGRMCVLLGLIFMGGAAVVMFFVAPWMMAVLTPVLAVQTLGTGVLRIEAFAEPLYSVSITASGAMRGAGDTLMPSVLVLVSMWGVRIPASILLSSRWGLYGVWIAMCGELCFRGTVFLVRLLREKWLHKAPLV